MSDQDPKPASDAASNNPPPSVASEPAQTNPQAPAPDAQTPTTTQSPPADSAPAPKPAKPRISLKKRLKTIGGRIYTALLLVAVGSICSMALLYLFRMVFTPAKLPEEFSQWQGRLDSAALRQEHIPGVTENAGRSPASHYHKVDRWFTPDPHNSCTASGCHSPLPHQPKTPIAAFPNLHVTFLDCRVCHEQTNKSAVAMHWVTTSTNRPQETPAVLRLVTLLETMGTTRPEAQAAHPKIIALLREVIATGKTDRDLEELLVQIDTSVPDNPFWRKSVAQLAHDLPMHARGEYGAKLVRQDTATDSATVERLTKSYLAAGEGSDARKQLEKQIHQTLLAKPNACANCHAADAGVLDFASLGYSAARTKSLRALPLAKMIQQIREGERFQLPQLLEGPDGR